MTEEVTQNTNPDTVITPNDPPEIEVKAREMGWRPKESFEGEETDFIDAAEFVRRKPLFDKIESQSRQLKEVQKALKALEIHHSKVREAEYQHALTDLKNQKRQALEDGNAEQLIAIDERITELKADEKIAQAQATQNAAQPDPRFVTWVNANDWYIKDQEMKEFADGVGLAHAKANPGKSPEEILDYVEKRVKKAYSDKFTNPNKSKPSAVDTGTTTTPTRQPKGDDFELNDEEKKVMNTLVRQGLITKEKYIEDLKRVRG